MNYGFFDEENREYVITKPNTPAPWANYLGSPAYGAIISNNAGGYSFVESGANGRIIRYHFNADDKPGRYIYLRDNDKKDYWSASWQPVGKDLNQYESECRHGTAYTAIKSNYDCIQSETLYYVPLNATHEVWRIKVTNNGSTKRNLSAFGFVEFTSQSNYEQDMVNLQYTQFITRTEFLNGNMILQRINEFEGKKSDGTNGEERFFGIAGAKVNAYDGDLQSFLGNYRSYANPIAVESGKCGNTLNYNHNSCGVLQTDFTLEAGETKEFAFLLGKKDEFKAAELLKSYSNLEKIDEEVDEEVEKLKSFWHGKLENLQVKTPDKNFNVMVNTWNAYQCFITFIWSRAASFFYCGQRNGYGYRDTVQDIQGIIHLDPALACDRIKFMLSAQALNGGGLPLVKYTHNPGHEDTPDEISYVQETGHPAYRADDALWLFPTVSMYINESGNLDFLNEVIPFANGGEATVYDHLKKAVQFSMERLGDHGMPAGLYADWNDCLRLGKKGESTFVAFQLYYAMKILKEYAKVKNDNSYVDYLENTMKTLYDTIQTTCWEEDRFVRGIREDGVVVGSKKDTEANMWLNPQSWSVISGVANEQQAKLAMDQVWAILNTEYGAQIMYPAYRNHAFDGARMVLFNPGTKENAGIFSQPQGWLILAEALRGEGNRAYQYFKECNPANMNDKAEIRNLEPYVHGQFIESTDSSNLGRANVHWLTGTATTVMVACVEGILGINPSVNGIVVNPCIPSEWDGLEISKVFRGKKLNIKVKNPNHSQKGIREVIVNGEKCTGTLIPIEMLKEVNDISIVMI
ncbi:MAG TPA: N,N'-diacetylchitobiose phosphorylase [Oscillospiraceae bacterium]|nr:N,N'-diacetylchitobiose phosphorylase [Oscillospiraceae bacterium]